MLIWEDKDRFTNMDWMADEIEKIGKPVTEKYKTLKPLQSKENGRYWFKHFKVWEFPFIWWWLQQFKKSGLKVMDFGCWVSPFPQFLARHGYEVWGVDNDAWQHIKVNDLKLFYPNVYYVIDDVLKMTDSFDVIISCSVLEHIPQKQRLEILLHLRKLLRPKGKMIHVVDFYFPQKKKREGKRVDFWGIAQNLGFQVNPVMCPCSPEFEFGEAKKKINFLREWNEEARIAIGDDL